MARIAERIYRNGAIKIFEKSGWNVHKINRSNFLAEKSSKKIIFRNCGKNLPFSVGFPWETWIRCKYLDELDNLSAKYSAKEAYIVYSYAILDDNFEQYFNQIVNVEGLKIGCKAISTEDRDNFKKRIGFKNEKDTTIDLDRKNVPDILLDINSI